MRSARLLRLLLLLQSKRRLTAEICAEELEVSPRTVYRDLDALVASGVPVVSERGPGGGIALAGNWTTQVPGLEEDEVTALAAFSSPLALAGLGLSEPLERALEKLTAALPPLQRVAAQRAQGRLHIDPSGWFASPEASSEHLALLRTACFEDRCVRLEYRSLEGAPRERRLEPLGLVLKGSEWYLVALDRERDERVPRVFRGSRIAKLRLLDERFERPPKFVLASFWKKWMRDFLEARPSYPVTLRLTPAGAALLAGYRPSAERRALQAIADRKRPGRVRIDFERHSIALSQLTLLGGDAEVITPRVLRADLREIGRTWAALYERKEQRPERRSKRR